jgi:hypothetical protein
MATILVKNSAGQPLPGATVRLYSNGNAPREKRFDLELITDGSGKATYDFTDYYKSGQAGFAVLDISVSKGNLEGEGIIKVEEEQTTEEVVVLQ